MSAQRIINAYKEDTQKEKRQIKAYQRRISTLKAQRREQLYKISRVKIDTIARQDLTYDLNNTNALIAQYEDFIFISKLSIEQIKRDTIHSLIDSELYDYLTIETRKKGDTES